MYDQTLTSGKADVNGAAIYYETAGEGTPLVFIHAGVADCRQWNNEFAAWARKYRVMRYDLRGYGRSLPVDGDITHLADLETLLERLQIREPAVFVGCSLGGGLAINFALSHPEKTAALVLVGSAPNGLELDVPTPALFAEAEAAFEAKDWDRLAEVETQIWFDGIGRSPDQVDPVMRRLALDMGRQVLANEVWAEGRQQPDLTEVAANRLGELDCPALIVIGEHDVPYILAAADYMAEHLSDAQVVRITDAAHLTNMYQPEQFRTAVDAFLQKRLADAG